jgi:phosphatidylserine/phosphatidylglycerophosphate/cardiolipin synthase-like enzyme
MAGVYGEPARDLRLYEPCGRSCDNSLAAKEDSMPLTVKAHKGDAKTLLAFDLPKAETTRLAGFTIQCQPQGQAPYYLFNDLQFETPGDHAQVATEPPYSSVNAPFHKFRWLHVPGVAHQGLTPFFGPYTYTVTPRYFDANGSMLPLDASLSVSVDVNVVPFVKGSLEIRFTRGYVQSQGYVRRFGPKAVIRPPGKELVFDTSQQAGIDPKGDPFRWIDEYVWLGYTARQRIFELLEDVLADQSLNLDVFAYDLNEPDLVTDLLQLAEDGRIRIILDDASLHHAKSGKPKPEDVFETTFKQKATGQAAIIRGHFGRFAHDKIMIASSGGVPRTVLTGSTNFSVTGLYVNSNHVVVSTDPELMSHYHDLFQTVWDGGVSSTDFRKSDLSKHPVSIQTAGTPRTEITFSPHSSADANTILDGIAARVAAEGQNDHGSVLFAVMEMDVTTSKSQVYTALTALHENEKIFTYGVSDNPEGIYLYEPGKSTGVLVTGLPVKTQLPPPFNQVPGVQGHQIHHKFVVCGFNGDDPVVYCGSSNLAPGGEEKNGDNLLAIHDRDVATAFAIEAVALVDRFQFLDRYSDSGPKSPAPPPALLQQTAQSKGAHLSTTDGWTKKFYDPNDLYCLDRELFALG